MKLMVLAVAAAVTIWAGDSSRYKEDFHYSFNPGAGGRLDLENYNGSIEITGWDQGTVDISGTKYCEEEANLRVMKIEATKSGNAVHVRTVRPDPPHRWNCGAKYVIRAPRQTELGHIQSSNGPIRVEDIEGASDLTTSNGPVRLRNMKGRVAARTSNGPVDVQTASGGVSIHTSNGSITLDNVKGTLQATTSNGAIRGTLVDSAANEPIQLSTSNGAIDVRLEMPRNNDITANTSNGSITVRMPANAGARLNARTSQERIQTDFDLTVRGTLSKSHIEGTIGAGGPVLELTTSNGAIRLLKI